MGRVTPPRTNVTPGGFFFSFRSTWTVGKSLQLVACAERDLEELLQAGVTIPDMRRPTPKNMAELGEKAQEILSGSSAGTMVDRVAALAVAIAAKQKAEVREGGSPAPSGRGDTSDNRGRLQPYHQWIWK